MFLGCWPRLAKPLFEFRLQGINRAAATSREPAHGQAVLLFPAAHRASSRPRKAAMDFHPWKVCGAMQMLSNVEFTRRQGYGRHPTRSAWAGRQLS